MRKTIEYRKLLIRVKLKPGTNGEDIFVMEAEHTRSRTPQEIARRKEMWGLENPGKKLKGTPSAWATKRTTFKSESTDIEGALADIKSQIDQYADEFERLIPGSKF